RKPVMARDGRSINDLALLIARLELGGSRLYAPQDAINIDTENPFHLFGCDVGYRLNLRYPGIVDDDVETAKRLFSMVNRSVDIIALADICGERRCLAAERLDFLPDRIQLVSLQVDQRNVEAILGQPQSD